MNKLKKYNKYLKIEIMVSKNFDNLDEIEKVSTTKTKLISKLTAQEVKTKMEKIDLVISACGQTIHELFF
ncbi:MAG: hypothetical protein WBG30_03485 [Psychrilyobacter sp.]|uniref:hypothetical protein n=1 Tax=Psychrilyobacter sp. TaxID=2586924 RepID=UPI003C76A04A